MLMSTRALNGGVLRGDGTLAAHGLLQSDADERGPTVLQPR